MIWHVVGKANQSKLKSNNQISNLLSVTITFHKKTVFY